MNTTNTVVESGSTNYNALSAVMPDGQQRGQITYFPRSILSSPMGPRAAAYIPGLVPAGQTFKFRKGGKPYLVGAGGNLINAH